MRLLIPTADAEGTNAQLSGHFGKAPFYSVADTETGAVITVANPSVESSHGHSGCVPAAEVFGGNGFDAVICQGIGRGALHQLTQAGVPVFVHDGPDVAAAVEGFRSRTVRLANEGDGCGGGSGSCGCHGHN
jgi:predicted Fe-Mo cluster-binding NifX family protein